MNVRTLGINLAKNVFLVQGVDSQGKTVVRRELRRQDLQRDLQVELMVIRSVDGRHATPADESVQFVARSNARSQGEALRELYRFGPAAADEIAASPAARFTASR